MMMTEGDRLYTLNVAIKFIPLKFGIKEKILAIRYFKSVGKNNMIRFLSSPSNTDDQKLSEIRDIMKSQFSAKMYKKLEEMKEDKVVEDFSMYPDDLAIIFDVMLDTEDKLVYWEKEWKRQTSIMNMKGLGLRCLGIKVETKRGGIN